MQITQAEQPGLAKLEFRYNEDLLARVRKIPGKRYNEHPLGNYWTVPESKLQVAALNGTLSPGYLWPKLLHVIPQDIFRGLSVEVKVDRLRISGKDKRGLLLKSLYDLCSYEYEIEREPAIGSLIKAYRTSECFIVTFPRGLLNRITSFLSHFRFNMYKEYLTEDKPEQTLDLMLNEFTPREYQQKACSKIMNGDISNRAILVMATGAGKTILSAAITAQINVPTIFYTYSLDLLEQTIAVYEKALGTKIGKVGGRHFTIEPITIASIQTVYSRIGKTDTRSLKLFDYLSTVKAQFIDEGHMLGAETIYATTSLTNAYYSYALTATPFREDGKEIFIEAAAGPIIELIQEQELTQGGYILPVEVEIYPVKHYPAKVKRYATLYNKEIVDHWERTRTTVKAAKKYADKQVIVLVKDIFHGNKFAELLQAPFIHGTTPATDRKDVLQKFKEKQINLLIASSILKQGVDLPEAEVLILAHGGASIVELIQKIGRVRRPSSGKAAGIVIDFYDEIQPPRDDDVFRAQSQKRLAFYQSKSYKITFHEKGSG